MDAALLVLKSMGLSLDDLERWPREPAARADLRRVRPRRGRHGYRQHLAGVPPLLEADRRAVGRPAPGRADAVGGQAARGVRQGERGAAPQQPGRRPRRREPDLGAALPVQPRRGRRADRREGQPRPQGRQAPPPAVHPPGTGRRPAGGDQPGRRHHGQRPGTRHAHRAAAHRDRLPPRRRARAPSPGPGPRAVPGPAPGEGRDVPLAAGLPDPDGGAGAARRGAERPGRRASCCATGTGARSPTAGTTSCGFASAGNCPGSAPRGSARTGSGTPR